MRRAREHAGEARKLSNKRQRKPNVSGAINERRNCGKRKRPKRSIRPFLFSLSKLRQPTTSRSSGGFDPCVPVGFEPCAVCFAKRLQISLWVSAVFFLFGGCSSAALLRLGRSIAWAMCLKSIRAARNKLIVYKWHIMENTNNLHTYIQSSTIRFIASASHVRSIVNDSNNSCQFHTALHSLTIRRSLHSNHIYVCASQGEACHPLVRVARLVY